MKNTYPFSGVLVRFDKGLRPLANNHPQPDIVQNEKNESGKTYGNELHVNIWNFESENIFDIGLMVHQKDISDVSRICIDIPWDISVNHIFDIATKIDGERILEAIFNRDVCYHSGSDSRNPKVSFLDEPKKDFLLVRLNNTTFEVEPIAIPGHKSVSRIIITPDFETIKSDLQHYQIERFYFRLRLLKVPQSAFATLFIQRDRNLLSSCIEESVVDFRLNPRRGVPPEILYTAASKFLLLTFAQMHLFVVVHRDKQPIFQSKNFKACRSLEDESVWNNYIRLDGNNNEHHVEQVQNYLGYQWSETNSKELVALGRFTRVTSSNWIMLRFILIALLLGAVSNGIWELWEKTTSSKLSALEPINQLSVSIATLLILVAILAVVLNPIFGFLSKYWRKFKRSICRLCAKR